MKQIEVPDLVDRVFARLCRGENRILSRNGLEDDADLFARVEEDEERYRTYFSQIGFKLERADGCYYMTSQDEPQANLENKLDRMIRLLRNLDFFLTHIESFGEGQIFSAPNVAARCNADPKAERFLQSWKGNSNADRLRSMLDSWVRQGFLSEYDSSRQEYKVLSSVNYLFEFADRIEITQDSQPPEPENAEA